MMRGTGAGGNISWGKSFCLLWCWSDISLDETCNASKQLAALPLSDRVSVIKHDGLPFLTQTLTQILQTPPPLTQRSIHFGPLYSSRVNCCAVESPWQKHKSWKEPDMSETSPWLWWVTTGAENSNELLRLSQTNSKWEFEGWVEVVLYSSGPMTALVDWICLLVFFFPFFQATTHSARAATELQ